MYKLFHVEIGVSVRMSGAFQTYWTLSASGGDIVSAPVHISTLREGTTTFSRNDTTPHAYVNVEGRLRSQRVRRVSRQPDRLVFKYSGQVEAEPIYVADSVLLIRAQTHQTHNSISKGQSA